MADEGARRRGAATARKAARPRTRATRGSRGTVLEVSRRRCTARRALTGTLKILLRIGPIRAFTRSSRRAAGSTLRLRGMLRLATTGRGAGMTAGGSPRMTGGRRVMLRRRLVSLFFFFIARESQRRARHSESKQQPDCAPYRFRGSGL